MVPAVLRIGLKRGEGPFVLRLRPGERFGAMYVAQPKPGIRRVGRKFYSARSSADECDRRYELHERISEIHDWPGSCASVQAEYSTAAPRGTAPQSPRADTSAAIRWVPAAPFRWSSIEPSGLVEAAARLRFARKGARPARTGGRRPRVRNFNRVHNLRNFHVSPAHAISDK